MREILLKKRDIKYKDFVRRSALESDYLELITEDCVLLDENGKIRAIYMTLDGLTDELVTHLHNIRFDSTTRTSGLSTRSRIFGYMPRIVMRSDYCRVASLSKDSPKANKALEALALKVTDIYKGLNPFIFEKHKKLCERVKKNYLIPQTLFTSGIINENNPLKYHFDSGNFKDVASVMVGVKQHIKGGYLAMPEYGIALEIAHDSITIFDGQDILHGVTPIEKLHRDAKRYTIVYYSLAKMWNCGELSEELARIRQVKMNRELKRAGITPRHDTESLGDIK